MCPACMGEWLVATTCITVVTEFGAQLWFSDSSCYCNLSGYLLRNLRESIRDLASEVLDSAHVMI